MNSIPVLEYSNRKRVIKVLVAMSFACCVLTAFRVHMTNNFTYLFLIWNLVLAWVPLVIAYKLRNYYANNQKNYSVLIFAGALWLLFFPNSPYIITDLIHLDPRNAMPIWYDAILIFAFAMTGLIAGFLSLYFIHEILDVMFNKTMNWVVIFMVFILTGYGIYLGRVLRWNSWDLFTRPKPLIRDVTMGVFNAEAIFMTLVFTFFMIFSYLILHSIIHLKNQIHQNDQHQKVS